MVEKESKKLLTAEEYSKFNNEIIWGSEFLQINYYYDTNDYYLNKKGFTIRIRSKNNKKYLQIKYPDLTNDKLVRSREEEQYAIDCIPETLSLNEYSINLENIANIEKVNFIGSLITYRKVCDIGTGVMLFLDKNIYLDKIDYEMELEYSDENSNILEFLSFAEISFDNISTGKCGRFINRIKEMQNSKKLFLSL